MFTKITIIILYPCLLTCLSNINQRRDHNNYYSLIYTKDKCLSNLLPLQGCRTICVGPLAPDSDSSCGVSADESALYNYTKRYNYNDADTCTETPWLKDC